MSPDLFVCVPSQKGCMWESPQPHQSYTWYFSTLTRKGLWS